MNPRDTNYHLYGGRGIEVCSRWLSFDSFYLDMGQRPTKKHSLDRIDVNGNYDPSNCKWSTAREQNVNRRDNVFFMFRGEAMCLSEWAERLGLKVQTMADRRRRGWGNEETFLAPPNYTRAKFEAEKHLFVDPATPPPRLLSVEEYVVERSNTAAKRGQKVVDGLSCAAVSVAFALLC